MNRLNDLADFWGTWLLHSGWQSAIVVGIVAILLVAARRTSAQFRYALLVIALVKFAAPPFFNLSMGLFSQARSPISSELTTAINDRHLFSPNDTDVRPAQSLQGTTGSTATQILASPQSAKSDFTPVVAPSQEAPAAPIQIRWGLLSLLLIHVGGMMIVGCHLRNRYRHIQTLIRNSTAAPDKIIQLTRETARFLGLKSIPEVHVSRESESPFATGLFRRIILLPVSVLKLPSDQLQIILGHELIHIRRHDLTIGWLETYLSILWWFHPGIWWLKGQLRRTREDCCDDVLLASRLTMPVRYCETLIEAAAHQCWVQPDPLVLGFSNGEHPAARRIRRLMDSSLFRTQRLQKLALLLVVIVGLVLIPGIRPPRAPVTSTSLMGLFGWKNLPFDPGPHELRIIEECRKLVGRYRSTYHRDGRRTTHFDDPFTRDELQTLLQQQPDFFYPQYLLGTWYCRNGDVPRGQLLKSTALAHAPIVLTQRYRTGNGKPLSNIKIDTMAIECNRVKNHSLNPELHLEFVDLTTDSQGEVALPVYDTVFRLASRSFPEGYDTEMRSLGWFRSTSRVGVLPEVTAWKRNSRPRDFTRAASESAWLAEAKGTRSDEIVSGLNHYRIGRVARSQADGQFTELVRATSPDLPPLPRATNSRYMDHAIIDLVMPVPDRFEIDSTLVLDSQTKIPLASFQRAADLKVLNKNRFHLFSLIEDLPEEVDLVLKVRNYPSSALRMMIPVAATGNYEKQGVTFYNEYLGAGQHEGWSSTSGFYQEAKMLDSLSEMLFKIEAPENRRFSLLLVTKDGERISLRTFSPVLRIPRPLTDIDHFELLTDVPVETIYFEKISLPSRRVSVIQELPHPEFLLTGAPETQETEMFSPLVLRCKTLEGDAYSNASFSGEFGYGMEERPPETRDIQSKCSVVLELRDVSGITLKPEYFSRSPANPLQTASGSRLSGPWGTVTANSLAVPLHELKSVKVRLGVK